MSKSQPKSKTKMSKKVGKGLSARLGFNQAFSSLGASLLKDIFAGPVGKAWDELVLWNFSKPKEWALGPFYYDKLWKAVMEQQEFSRHPLVGSGLQDYWLESLLDDPNLFHRKAELAPFDKITPALVQEYADDLKGFLNHVIRVDWEKEVIQPINRKLGIPTPSFEGIRGLDIPKPLPFGMEARMKIKQKILEASSERIVREIADYFHEQGFGAFGRFRAFRWNSLKQSLDGVEALDPIRLENLVGYDEQRKPLLENVQAFVKGKPANNALLYGERGTGKSSTVKALLNVYHAQGLRLVEVLSAHLMDFPVILSHLRGRPEKFILFVDDLSFEENETSYKGLKAVLEGTLEASPQNVILIATSNRRHLIREFFGDRAGGVVEDGEIHGADTVEEKLSLADRFGLVISFYAPDQDTFLKMVDEWAKFEGIRMAEAELHLKAVQWTRFNNGRSGRAARQFVNDLKGKL